MDGLLLFQKLVKATLDRLCRQIVPPAGLVLLCAVLAFLAGQAAQQTLSEGVDFSGLILAVTAPEGDRVPEQLEFFLGNMRDVRSYCRVEAMPYDTAVTALSAGEVTAVLVLPESFVRGVQWGENPDVRLIVDARRPLGALLTLWIGQSASDLLASVQSGVYAVLDVCALRPIAGLSRDRIVTEINLRYIQWVLNRQDLFRSEAVLPTGQLPIALHYELSILWFLLLALAPAFSWCYQGTWLQYHRRLGYLRRNVSTGFWAAFAACAVVMSVLFFAALELLLRAPPLPMLGVSALCALFFAAYAALCGLAANGAAGCGTLSFLLNAAFLLLSGGVIPPALQPGALRRLGGVSPITWLRALSAAPLGYDTPFAAAYPLLATAALCALCAWLYARRVRAQEIVV